MKNKISFIRLHNSSDNYPIIIRKNSIILITKDIIEENCGRIFYFDGINCNEANVNESPEKIFGMLNEEFIRLHDSDDNTPVIFNTSNVVKISKNNNNQNVVFYYDGEDTYEYEVNETPEQIYSIMMGEKKETEKKK